MIVNGLADLLLRHGRQRRAALFTYGVFVLLLTSTTLGAISWRPDTRSSEANCADKNLDELNQQRAKLDKLL